VIPKALARWDQDGSSLTDELDPNDVCLPGEIKDDPEPVTQLERTRSQDEPEAMEDLGLCPVSELIGWMRDVEYDC
jgi:hypothetical protein